MPRMIVNGVSVDVADGVSVAAALMQLKIIPRRALSGEARGPLCGMGVCFECRVTIDGQPHERGCMVRAREGMEVRSDEG